MLDSSSTIFALSSGRDKAGIAVVRVSGPNAGPALKALAGSLPQPRFAALAPINGPSGDLIDRGLALWFPAPASVTGEDVAEIQIHGGPAIVSALLAALGAQPGLRPAEAGEFSRRAFHNGKLDLTQIEALADAINAETEAQRAQAVRQMEGDLGQTVEGWRTEVMGALAHIEASIDFVDEELPENIVDAAAARIEAVLPPMQRQLDDSHRGERLRDGVRVVLVGAPNVGKSSVLNRLAGRDAAIVSPGAGTTRDVLEIHLDLAGYPVILADTAGLREVTEDVEAEGVRRAHARAEAADIKIALFDGAIWPEQDAATADLVDADTLVVINKSDLMADAGDGGSAAGAGGPGEALLISAKTGSGLDDLVDRLGQLAGKKTGLGEKSWLTRARHRDALVLCVGHLQAFLSMGGTTEVEIAAEELRLGARALGRITGRVNVDDLLDIVFFDFCLGK
jgi:tRNA modification GTPase